MTILNYLLPEKLFLKYEYKKCFGKKLNLENLITFNEKNAIAQTLWAHTSSYFMYKKG